MSCKLAIEDLNLYYGDFHALKSINMEIQPNEITAFIGPSGCGKSTLLKSLNRMNDLVEGCRITGADKIGRRGHLPRDGREPFEKTCRHGVSEAEPVPDERVRQHRLRPAHARHPRPGRSWTRSWSVLCRSAAIWDEAEGPTEERARWDFPADSSRDCASPARWRWSRRCC